MRVRNAIPATRETPNERADVISRTPQFVAIERETRETNRNVSQTKELDERRILILIVH